MRFGILTLTATVALAVLAAPAKAQWINGHGHQHRGHSALVPAANHLYLGPHLDYHNGHYHYHDGFYRSAPLYPSYGIGYQLGYAPGLRVQYGSSYAPLGVGNGYYSTPYYRGNAYRGYRWRW